MDSAPKQQIVERVKQANNILVTVSNDPSVDQLASCIGLTLLLNAMGKHATAVFSGQTPSTIEFLQPEKTLEPNTDSLRDFIISLDKSKADKLRYKVEDQVVRIFITPYRTKISESDLIFSQGDFNVEVVIALGVKEREHIDNAITAHGRILHDATVVSINAGESSENNEVGSINWQDPAASSLCEMVVSISEAFGSGLIDNQMATAFLTGIVAQTERFSNKKTSPKVMTMSAQLMAAGANQQLIATKLAEKVSAPINPASGSNAVPADQQANDVITIEHADEIKIDDSGNIDINSQPEPESDGQAEPPAESRPEESSQNEDNAAEPEISLPEPEVEPETEQNDDSEPEVSQIHAGGEALPDRLPVGDHQSPINDDNSFALGANHKVIQPLNSKKDLKQDNDEDPKSKISTKRTVLDSDNDPALHNPFTANAQSPYDDNSLNTFSSAHDPGLLQHSKPSANADEHEDKPPVADKTLDDIQKELLKVDTSQEAVLDSADSARQAVEQIHNAMPYEETHPEPVSALNANPVEFDQLHNPAEIKPESSAEPDKPPPVPEPFKMPELAITPDLLTNLPVSLVSSTPNPVSEPPQHDVVQSDIPAISVSPDGTLRVSGVDQPSGSNNNDDMAPPAPPPVPPPMTPPAT